MSLPPTTIASSSSSVPVSVADVESALILACSLFVVVPIAAALLLCHRGPPCRRAWKVIHPGTALGVEPRQTWCNPKTAHVAESDVTSTSLRSEEAEESDEVEMNPLSVPPPPPHDDWSEGDITQ